MNRRKRILLITGGSVAGLLIVLVAAALIVVQTAWFANFAREKVIAAAQDATGGVAEIGSFEFDLSHLTVRIRNFVLHGTEPKTSPPLLRADLLELRLKLFSGFKKTVDLNYLGIERPSLNLILLPDGTTNIPQPKTPSKPSQTSSLETVVDLAVNQFRLNNGLASVLDRKAAFSGRGENLRVLLNYNLDHPSYAGTLAIDPLLLTSGTRSPLRVHVNVPMTLEKDAIRVQNARLNTEASQILVNAAMEHMNAPAISAHVNASVSLPEMQRSLDLGLKTDQRNVPEVLTAELAAQIDEKTNHVTLESAHVALGQTTLTASGSLNPGKTEAVQFKSSFALAELSRLLGVTGVSPQGALEANGRATLDSRSNYAVDGTLNSRDLSLRSGTTRIGSVGLASPFHADPYLISLDGLRLSALGGTLGAKIFLENLQNLSLEGNLRNFSVPVLAAAFTGDQLGYDGAINGSVTAKGDLKAQGTSGYAAQTRLGITPGTRGVPVSGRINAEYSGARGILSLGDSYLQLPHSRLELSGALNRQIELKLVSHNLNDFLPAANFGAAKPQTSLPVVLQNGTAEVDAQVKGDLSAPQIAAHLDMNNFAIEQMPLTRAALDLNASPRGAAIRNGTLTGNGLNTAFDASLGLVKWKPQPRSPLAANLTLRNGDLAQIAGLAGKQSLQAAGQVTADVHINGTYGNPLGGAALRVMNGSVSGQPFSRFATEVNLSDQLITLSSLELDTAGGSITGQGTFRHPRESFSLGHVQAQLAAEGIQLAQVDPITKQNAGVGGSIQLSASAAGDLGNRNQQTSFTLTSVTADLSATGLEVQKQGAGNLTATARTQNGTVNYNVSSNFAGSSIGIRGNTRLVDYLTNADASIKNLSLEKTLQIVGQAAIPARGTFSADAHVAGTVSAPNANLSFLLANANVYQEPIDRLQGQVSYSNTNVNIPSIQLDAPAGSITLHGGYRHAPNDFHSGALEMQLNSTDIQVAKIPHAEQAEPGLAGTLHLAADLSAQVRAVQGKPEILFSRLNADANATALHVNNRPLGGLSFTARTAGSNLNFKLDSDLAKSQIHGSGQTQLSGDYPMRASLTFSNIRYSSLAPFLPVDNTTTPLFEALVEGQATANGPLLNADAISGRLELSRVDFKTSPLGSPSGAPAHRTVELENRGPIVISLNRDVVKIEQMQIGGADTSINASGVVNLNNPDEPLNLNLAANLNLGILQDASREFYSSGNVSLNTAIRGSFGEPRANGRIELKNANINYSGAPNGLSNANGVILLNGTNASIQNLTGESGGGKIALTGFVGIGGGAPSFNLRATAARVRVRTSGISATSDASIELTGNVKRSLLAGTVTVHRIAYASSSDAGSLLSTASAPPSTPSSPSPLLTGMRLEIRILTAPDLQVISTYSNRLSVLANLTVRGTAETPGILGRVTVTDGQLVFFGNTYTVNTGTINFYDPNAISPVLNVSLETIAQGVDVTIGVTGPMDNLKLSYRSDPPLTFEQIVQLLATNTTPSNPVIAAHQPAPAQQSLSQMGESAVLGQAVANPLASRVQRVFGLTQFKIDPSVSGNNGSPDARVTLQEKIASNITFTYITDVDQSNSEIVRVQWDLTNSLSAVGLRDYNGNVSIEFFYKFTKR